MIGLDRLAEAPTGLVLVLKATAVLVAAWLCHGALARTNPRWRVLTWRCAAIGLAAVAVLAFAPPLATWRVAAPAVAPGPPVVAPSPVPEPAAPRGVAPPIPPPEPIGPPTPVMVRVPPRVDPKPASTPDGSIDLASRLAVAWVAGVAVGLARLAIGSLRLRRIVRGASEAPAAVREACRATAEGLGVRRRVRVVVSPAVASPCIAGVMRPTILLPAGMGLDAPGPDLDAVLVHELAHARNGDLAWNDLLGLATVALWFHPLAWRLRAAHAAACDAVCDAVAVDRLGDVATYGRALARLALRASAAAPARGLAMARACDVRRRVESLQRMVYRSPLPRRLVMSALLLSTLLAALVGGAAVIRAQDDPAKPEGGELKPLTIRALAPDGEPLEGVEVEIHHRGLKDARRVDLKRTTAGDGTAKVEYDPARASSSFALTLRKPGFVPAHVAWSGERRPIEIPEVKELRMARGTEVGGLVTDEAGEGIKDAVVTLSMPPTESDVGNSSFTLASVKTDARGRWRIGEAPAALQAVHVRVEHPRYRWSYGRLARGIDGLTAVLKRGRAVKGSVVGPDGKPLAGAVVTFGRAEYSSNDPTTRTDARGEFVLENCDPGPGFLTVQAEGLAPQEREVIVAEEGETSTPVFALEPGSTIRARVVDVQGRPVVGAYVAVDRWRGRQAIEFRANTDAEGRIAWPSAPKDAVLFDVFLDGYMRTRRVSLTAGEEQAIVLRPALTISGAVTDAKTGRPVPKFTVFQGRTEVDHDGVNWRRDEPAEFTEGRYVQSIDFPARSHHLRIEAQGYEPAESRAFRSDEGAATQAFALEPKVGVEAVVLLPDGRPAAGAEVVLLLPGVYASLKGDRFERGFDTPIQKAGDDGRFSISDPDGSFLIAAAHDAGFALETPGDLGESATLRLEPWARVEGRVMVGKRPGAGEEIAFQPERGQMAQAMMGGDGDFGAVTNADAEGRFVFDKVVPVPGYVGRVIVTDLGGGASLHSPAGMTPVDAKPGVTTRVTIGGDGRPVVGRVVLEGRPDVAVDWVRNEPARIAPSPGFLDRILLRNAGSWARYAASFDAEGRFRADDVPPGAYQLTVEVKAPARPGSRQIPETIARGRLEFVVPAGDVASAVDVGEVVAKLERHLNVGDEAPALDLERLDGPKGRFVLGDRRGKVVVLDFWATWCGPCRDEMPALKELVKAHGGDPRFELVGVSCDEAAGVTAGFAAKEGLNWTQAFAGPMGGGAAQDYGVHAIPSTFVIGPDGRIVAVDLRGEQLKEAVAKALAAMGP